ncbi:MAG TPA: archaeosortase/exosortase family protein [Candidatus Angelobacter sp.]|nr:archaeosortase/exosortase family protein [Candidatus Angelobacter sp.]
MELEASHPNSATESVARRSPEGRFDCSRPRFKGFFIFTALLAVGFGLPLLRLANFALHSELYSHILLIPFISGFLIWMNRGRLAVESRPSPGLAVLSFAAGAIVLAGYELALQKWMPEKADHLSATTLSFLLFWLGGAFIFLGAKYLRVIAFPVGFIFFSVPFPMAVKLGIETFLQGTSAVTAEAMFNLGRMPVMRTATHLLLPGFSGVEVAPECSGIHSTLVLVITCALAVYLFLKSPWHRLVLVLAIIPLGILRNGFRIFTIGELCVHIGPQMIDSPIHRRGGPVFFLLSLIPLFLLLRFLTKRELKREPSAAVSPNK